MKFLVVAVALCQFLAVQGMDEEYRRKFVIGIHENGADCVAETGAHPDDVKRLLAHQIPVTHEGKCMLFCLHKQYQVQNADGTINKDAAHKTMQDLKMADAEIHDKVLKIFNTCADTTPINSDPCITAGELGDCAVAESKKIGLSPEFLQI